MSQGYYLNVEPIFDQIIIDNISKMSDETVYTLEENLDELNLEVLKHNLYFGITACISMIAFYETTINTIITSKLNYVAEEILKSSYEVKLQIICHEYGFDLSDIKSDYSYELLRQAIRLRNDFVHYKSNFLFEGTIAPVDTKKQGFSFKRPLSESISKQYFEKLYSGIKRFLGLICEKCELKFNNDCKVIECDGRDNIVDFIIGKNDIRN